MAISGIILAGGRSSRMGLDKTLLQYNNETLIERTVRNLRHCADEIIIASNSTAKYNLPGIVEVPDIYPDMGPLGGMHAALLAARHQHSFVVSCDMPFFSTEFVKYMVERKAGYDVVVAEIQKRWEPLCAVYSRNCIEPIERLLQAGVSKVYLFYTDVRVLTISESQLRLVGDIEEIFCNLNTPADLALLKNKHHAL